jgi:hypothetical protein
MLKAVHLALVTFAALFAFVALLPTTTSAVRTDGARVAHGVHVGVHDPASLDDDDDDDDDDAAGVNVVLSQCDDDDDDPDDRETDDATNTVASIADPSRFPPPSDTQSLSMTRPGLRASGEHRASCDRPPRG